MGTLNDNIAEYLNKTNGADTACFVWGNIGGLYPSWAWGTLLCSNDNNAANFIGIANSDKTAAFAHYENGAWEKVPVESLSNLTTTNKSSLVDAINELNSNPLSILTRSAILLEQAFDYNELKTTGAYYLTGSDPALAKNRPADCTNCYMLVFALIPTRVCQIILPGNDDRAWIRSTVTDSSEWRSWVAIF